MVRLSAWGQAAACAGVLTLQCSARSHVRHAGEQGQICPNMPAVNGMLLLWGLALHTRRGSLGCTQGVSTCADERRPPGAGALRRPRLAGALPTARSACILWNGGAMGRLLPQSLVLPRQQLGPTSLRQPPAASVLEPAVTGRLRLRSGSRCAHDQPVPTRQAPQALLPLCRWSTLPVSAGSPRVRALPSSTAAPLPGQRCHHGWLHNLDPMSFWPCQAGADSSPRASGRRRSQIRGLWRASSSLRRGFLTWQPRGRQL